MTENPKPMSYAEASNTDKNLLRIYVNSVLSAAATSLIADQSLQLKAISLDEPIQKIANDIVAHESDITLASLVDEALAPFKDSVTEDWFVDVRCFLRCRLFGGSVSQCNNECGTEHTLPQE
jgi:hypothetical protein